MNNIPPFISKNIPESLETVLINDYQQLSISLSEDDALWLNNHFKTHPHHHQQLSRLIVGSRYAFDYYCKHPDILIQQLDQNQVDTTLTKKAIQEAFTPLKQMKDANHLDKCLRQQRHFFMCLIIWREVNHLSDFSESTLAISTLAECCVQIASYFHYKRLTEQHGLPMNFHGDTVQNFLVIGMGKLGGKELNLSSDIDLIFAYPESGNTNGECTIENQVFFTRLGQGLIKSLNQVTTDGFVFRVDMRLRPYGQSGELASNFNRFKHYYQTQGRDWERFALLKARVIANINNDFHHASHITKEQFYQIITPFVYRQYIDFTMVESLRQLKQLIRQEIRRKHLKNDIKLGDGGIREIEFIAQTFQLIRGGRDTRLQERHLIKAIKKLTIANTLDAHTQKKLTQAYLFLRKTEHALQAYKDQQTQSLPKETLQQTSLAWVLGFNHWEAFLQELNFHRQYVKYQFEDLIANQTLSIKQTIPALIINNYG